MPAFDPNSIPGLLGWYTPTNIFRLNGSASGFNQEVALWKNQLADDHHFTNSVGNTGVYPTNRLGGPNGSNSVIITLAGFAPIPLTNNLASSGTNFSIYAIMEIFPTATFNNIREVFVTGGALLMRYHPDQSLGIQILSGAQTIATNTWMSVAFVNAAPATRIYTNGVLYLSQAGAAVPGIVNMYMGVPGGNSCNGGFVEMLFYDAELTANNLSMLQGYYINKYGL